MSLLLRRPPGREAYPGDVGGLTTLPKSEKVRRFILTLNNKNVVTLILNCKRLNPVILKVPDWGKYNAKTLYYKIGLVLIRHTNYIKKNQFLVEVIYLNKKYRGTLSNKRHYVCYFSDASVVNADS